MKHAKVNARQERILLLILLSVVLLSLILFALWHLFSEDAVFAVVTVSGKVYARLPLDTDGTLRIEGVGGYNLLVVRDGEVSITDADCPSHDCVKQGAISPDTPLNLRVITCLPHEVTVTLRGGDE